MRTVMDDGWPYQYRAAIVEYNGWFRRGWKYIIERKWVHWDHHKTSFRVYPTQEDAEVAANLWLDAHDNSLKSERKEYVG